MPKHLPPGADPVAFEERFRLERRLADRLRHATADERSRLYAEVYGEYAAQIGAAAAEDTASADLQLRLLEPWLEATTRFIEVGAGSGAVARQVARRVAHATAIEAVIPSLESLGEEPTEVRPPEVPGTLQWMTNEQANRAIKPDLADLVFSCHVLEHLHPDDLNGHLEQVRGWLKPGGVYVMVTPNRLHGPHDISGYFEDQPTGFHLREYSHSDLADALQQAQFGSVTALDPTGGKRSLFMVRQAERLLDVAGFRLRRWLFEATAVAQNAPLRPLEQVVLAAHR